MAENPLDTIMGEHVMVPTFLDGDIGPSFFTPAQADWRRGRAGYGSVDDPDVGAYFLDRIHWNKDTGTGSYSMTDPSPFGWVDLGPGDLPVAENATPPCRCQDGGNCRCK